MTAPTDDAPYTAPDRHPLLADSFQLSAASRAAPSLVWTRPRGHAPSESAI